MKNKLRNYLIVSILLFTSFAYAQSNCEITLDGVCVSENAIVHYQGVLSNPPTSEMGSASQYFDPITGKLLCSEDGGAYGDCIATEDLTLTGDLIVEGTLRVDGTAYLSSLSTPYANIITVAKSGGDYTTIQGAIDSITDNATDNRYLVSVYPGDYAENVVMEEYVDLYGVGQNSVRITPTSGTAVTFDTTFSNLYNLTIDTDYTTLTENTSAIIITDGQHTVRDVRIDVDKSGGNYTLKAVTVSGGRVSLFNTFIYYDITGATTGSVLIQEAVTVLGTSTILRCNSTAVFGSNNDTNDIFAGFGTISGTDIELVLANSFLQIINSGSGIIAGLYTLANESEVLIGTSQWTVIAANGGSAYGGFVDSIASNSTARTSNNTITVTSASGNAYSGNIGGGDEWNSYFDIIIAEDGMSGAGTFNIVASDEKGDLTVSSDLSVGGTIQAWSTIYGVDAEFSGNVGIGTTTPDHFLVVDTGSTAIGGFMGVRLGNDNRFMKMGNPGGDISYTLVDDNDVIAFGQEDSFATDGSSITELLRIEREGGTDRTLVGVGNNNPQFEVDVVGDINLTENLYVGSDIDITGSIHTILPSLRCIQTDDTGALSVAEGLCGSGGSGGGGDFLADGSVAMTGSFSTDDGRLLATSAASGVVTLGGSGGTNNENLTLDFETTPNTVVIGSTTANTTMKYNNMNFSLGDNNSATFGTGNDMKLAWSTIGNHSGKITTNVASTGGTGHVSLIRTSDLYDADRSPLTTSADPVWRVYSSDATQAGDYIEMYHDQTDANIVSGSGDIVLSPATGNVGIGTTTPSTELEVVGDMIVSGSITATGGTINFVGSDVKQTINHGGGWYTPADGNKAYIWSFKHPTTMTEYDCTIDGGTSVIITPSDAESNLMGAVSCPGSGSLTGNTDFIAQEKLLITAGTVTGTVDSFTFFWEGDEK